MVHRESRVEFAVMPESEVAVRRIWSEGQDIFCVGGFYGRENDLFLLVSEQSSVAAVRVEAEHGDSRTVNLEIPLEGSLHQAELAEDLLGRKAVSYVPERNMAGDDADFEAVADHDHRMVLDSELLLDRFCDLDLFGVLCDLEGVLAFCCRCHALLCDDRSKDHISGVFHFV